MPYSCFLDAPLCNFLISSLCAADEFTFFVVIKVKNINTDKKEGFSRSNQLHMWLHWCKHSNGTIHLHKAPRAVACVVATTLSDFVHCFQHLLNGG